MKKILRKFFMWLFSDELNKMQAALVQCEKERRLLSQQADRVKNLLSNFDISVDLHHYAPSWAVISLQGQKTDYIKFIHLPDSSIREIAKILNQFDRSKIDCSPMEMRFFRDNKMFKI